VTSDAVSYRRTREISVTPLRILANSQNIEKSYGTKWVCELTNQLTSGL